MNSDFNIALQVTAVGMALVFLTLVICAVVISLLSRIFKPTAEAAETEAGPAELLPASQPAPPVASQPVSATKVGDEAAAIAVALALASAAVGRAASVQRRTPAPPLPWSAPLSKSDEEILGEVVTVLALDPGQSSWRDQGRVAAAR